FQASATSSSSQQVSSNIKLQQKETQNSNWQEKYFLHGESSNIVTDVENQIHGCVNSSVSEDIDIYISNLHDINITADEILQEQRQDIINRIIIKGHSNMNQCEKYYRKIIEEFIKKLEIEMSIHLDDLQKQMENEKDIVFATSHNNIKDITIKAQNAKKDFLRIIQSFAEIKRQEIIKKIINISIDKTRQPLGYEQLRTLNLQIYSRVGIKEDEHGCDNISERNKFIKDINHAKSHQPIKRTVYLGSNFNSTLK
ncbi:unnamed protein product, partial [Rotaria sp. Silwood1]